MRYFLSFLLLFSFSLAQAISLKTMQNEKRVAYVIGNGDYDEAPMDYAVTAALNMRSFLQNHGFEVIYKENANKRDMIRSLRNFSSLMQGEGVALFYFAGHSIQVRGKNYLIPIDTSIENDHHVLYEAIELNAIIRKMKSAQNRLNILILNAGSQTPFGERYRSKKAGFAKLKKDEHTDVVFSSRPDTFSKHYPFTRKLTSILSLKGTSNKEGLFLFKKTNKEAYFQLSDQEFYFNLPDKLSDKEAKAWKKALSFNSILTMTAYLEQYPNGKHKDEALRTLEQIRLDQIEKEEKKKFLEKESLKSKEAKLSLEALNKEQEEKKKSQLTKEAELKRVQNLEEEALIEKARQAALIEEERLRKENTRFIEPVMVLIKAGTFMMGSNDEEENVRPQHQVSIEKDFYIGKYEITNVEYNEFLHATKKKVMIPPNWTSDMQPAVGVSWNDAHAYALWLSELTGRTYRLPTEEEWEYAARAGVTTRYYWGDIHQKKSTWFKDYPVNTHKYAWVKSNSKDITHPVGAKQPNAWGLHDITGNVWEWCKDNYSDDYNTPPEEEIVKVLRGGSWFSTPNEITLSHRGASVKDFVSYSIGFRLVREK